jgi:hypothetical protein
MCLRHDPAERWSVAGKATRVYRNGSLRSLSLPNSRFMRIDGCSPLRIGYTNNVSEPLDRTCAGRVLPKRDVSSHLIITGRIFRKNSPKVLGVEYHQWSRSDRPNQALNISVLPGRAERGGPISDAHCSRAGLECGAAPSRCKSPRKKIKSMTCPTSASGHVARPPVLIGGPPHAATSYNMHPCDAPAPAAGRLHKPIPLASRRSDRSCAGSTTDARWR